MYTFITSVIVGIISWVIGRTIIRAYMYILFNRPGNTHPLDFLQNKMFMNPNKYFSLQNLWDEINCISTMRKLNTVENIDDYLPTLAELESIIHAVLIKYESQMLDNPISHIPPINPIYGLLSATMNNQHHYYQRLPETSLEYKQAVTRVFKGICLEVLATHPAAMRKKISLDFIVQPCCYSVITKIGWKKPTTVIPPLTFDLFYDSEKQ